MTRGICVVGLGGSGQIILISLKERLIETYGRVPDSFVLLSLDTSAPEAGMSISGVNLKVPGSQRIPVTDADRADQWGVPSIEEFLMRERWWAEEGRPDEFHPLVTDAGRNQSVNTIFEDVMAGRSPHFADWVDVEDLHNLPPANRNIAAGAGQSRFIGRMALFLNYRNVHTRLSEALSRLFSAPVLAGDKYNIFVVGSVAGGTGSGIFIDILVIIRKILRRMGMGGQRRSVSLSTFLVLPSAFQQQHSIKEVGLLRPNSYAALREFDRFQLTHSITRPTLIRYGPGADDTQWVVDALSDHVYMVDAVGHPRNSAFPAIADFIAAKVTDARLPDGTPGGGGAMIENIENNFSARFYDRPRRKRYLGLNTFTYIVPINDIVRSASLRYLHEMYERLFGPPISQQQTATVKREVVLRVQSLFSEMQIGTLNRRGARENTRVPDLLRSVVTATDPQEPKRLPIDWVSLLQLLARTQDEYQEDYQTFQQALSNIEKRLLHTVEYSRKEDYRENFNEGARRLIRESERLLTVYLGPQHNPNDPQSRFGGQWDNILSKYDELRDDFAEALDFAVRDELNLRAESGKLKPNRLSSAHILVENLRERLQTVAAQMDVDMRASGAPERYISLLTRELKETQAEMEEAMDDRFIPLLAERPLKRQQAYIETVQEYLSLELGLRVFACVKRLLDIFGSVEKDDKGQSHEAPSVIARALTSLENWRRILKETDELLEEAHKRHEIGRREKAKIEVRRYLTDSEYENKIYQACLPALDKDLLGKDKATLPVHWVRRRGSNNMEDESPLLLELKFSWVSRPGVGPADIEGRTVN